MSTKPEFKIFLFTFKVTRRPMGQGLSASLPLSYGISYLMTLDLVTILQIFSQSLRHIFLNMAFKN